TVTVDGLVGNDLGSPQIFSGTINFDAIGEVKVQLNNYQAEHGRNGGAMVSIVTKSGTRDFKGSAYLYKRHESLNANDFFNNRNGIAKPLYRYTTVGATLGGPVRSRSSRTSCSSFTRSRIGIRARRSRSVRSRCRPRSSARATSRRASTRPASCSSSGIR
ncbi:MAG: hypothetical protein ACRD09_07440, partial [Vicinamibacterales bacterium]